MTSRDRIKAIRNQPRTMEEKRNLRYGPKVFSLHRFHGNLSLLPWSHVRKIRNKCKKREKKCKGRGNLPTKEFHIMCVGHLDSGLCLVTCFQRVKDGKRGTLLPRVKSS